MNITTLPPTMGKIRLKTPVSLYQGISNKLIQYSSIGEVFELMTDNKNEHLVSLSERLEAAKRTNPSL